MIAALGLAERIRSVFEAGPAFDWGATAEFPDQAQIRPLADLIFQANDGRPYLDCWREAKLWIVARMIENAIEGV